jgi:hypothetical protein
VASGTKPSSVMDFDDRTSRYLGKNRTEPVSSLNCSPVSKSVRQIVS